MQQFATEGAHKTCIDYLALKRHFTSNYDYQKYRGRVRLSLDSFKKRSDVQIFYVLSKNTDAHSVILSNIVKNPNTWVGKMVDSQGEAVYKQWKQRQQALSYNFDTELKRLDDNFKNNFIVSNGEYPPLLSLYFGGKVSIETLCILLDITGVLGYWKTQIQDKIIAGDALILFENYIPFIEYDRKKMEEKMENFFD